MKLGIIFALSIIIGGLLVFFSNIFTNGLLILSASLFLIIIFNILALANDNLVKYILYCFIVQTAYVLLDMSIAVLSGKNPRLALLQLANFFFAGLLLIASIKGNNISKLKVNNYLLIGITVSSLALAGLPGFNLFVGEYFLYILAFDIAPIVLGLCFLCSILTLLACLKIVSYAFNKGVYEKPKNSSKIIITALTIICLILGVIPWIEMKIFEVLSL